MSNCKIPSRPNPSIKAKNFTLIRPNSYLCSVSFLVEIRREVVEVEAAEVVVAVVHPEVVEDSEVAVVAAAALVVVEAAEAVVVVVVLEVAVEVDLEAGAGANIFVHISFCILYYQNLQIYVSCVC